MAAAAGAETVGDDGICWRAWNLLLFIFNCWINCCWWWNAAISFWCFCFSASLSICCLKVQKIYFEAFVLLGYDAISLHNWFPNFWGIKCPRRNNIHNKKYNTKHSSSMLYYPGGVSLRVKMILHLKFMQKSLINTFEFPFHYTGHSFQSTVYLTMSKNCNVFLHTTVKWRSTSTFMNLLLCCVMWTTHVFNAHNLSHNSRLLKK